jgi:SAM-dependent methyltransferase
MREHLLAFVEAATEAFGLEGPVYEFGVSSVNREDCGDGFRGCLTEASHVGCNLSQEVRTDRLEDLARLPISDAAARTVICIDTLQYVVDPIRTAQEMTRILAPGGTLVFGSSVDPDAPDPPGRFWRPTHEMVNVMMSGLEATLIGWQGPQRRAHTLFGVGAKSPITGKFTAGANLFLTDFQRRLDELATRARGWRMLRRLLALCRLGTLTKRKPSEYYQSSFVLHLPVGQQSKHDLLSSCLPDQQTGTRIDFSG